MGRALRITLLAAALAMMVAIGAWAFLFASPPGRTMVRGIAQSQLAKAIGGEVAIGALGGRLPDEIILTDARFTEGGAEWLSIERARIEWRPLALLRGEIVVRQFAIDGATLSGEPPRREPPEKKRGFVLPESLPHIRVDDIRLSSISVLREGADAPARLNATGSILTGGKALDITLKADGDDGHDFLSAIVRRTGDALAIDAQLRADKEGALAGLMNLGGAVELTAKGDGPLERYSISYNGQMGAYGAAKGSISADFTTLDRIDVQADGALGEKLSNAAAIIGEAVQIDAAFIPATDGGAISIRQFSSSMGKANGEIAWRNQRGALDTISLKAQAAFEEQWRPDIRPYIGDRLSIDANVAPVGEAYRVTGKAAAQFFEAALKDVETDLQSFARGGVDGALLANKAMPAPLDQGARIAGDVDLIFEERIAAENMTVTTIDGGVFSGAASYEFDGGAFTAKGRTALPAAMLAALDPRLAATSSVTGDVAIKGVADNFNGSIDAATPALSYNGAPLSPMRILLAFDGAPKTMKGKVSARASDRSRDLSANFEQGKGGAWRVSAIDYKGAGKDGAGFDLKGAAAIGAGTIALDLKYRGSENAEPWPGTPLEGVFTAKGSIARGAASNDLTINAPSLRSSQWSATDLVLTARGPADRLAVQANADQLTIAGAAPISKFSGELTAAMKESLALNLTALGAEIAGANLTLSSPATITLGKTVEVSSFRANVGRAGTIALDGDLSPSRWRIKFAAKNAPIVSAASTVDLSLDLDTARGEPANGAFTFASLLSKTANASLSGVFAWNGRMVRIRDDGKSKDFTLDLTLPLAMQRSPSISLAMDGAIRGVADYTGRLETVAGFLPAQLQSVEGDLALNASAAGTLDDPKLTGALTITDGAFTELATGLSVIDIDATARAQGALQGSRVDFKAEASGPRQNEKTVFAEGAITLGKEQKLASTFKLARARLSAGPISSVEATGEIGLSGPFDNLLAKGEIEVRSLNAQVFTPETTGLVDINVVAVDENGKAIDTGGRAATTTTISYDIDVKGDDRIFVRGRGLESEWRADLSIEGRSDEPVIAGNLRMRDGEITFSGRRFALTNGDIAFDRLSVNNPALNIRAERETGSGVTAAIEITGRALTPKIALTSTPSRPSEDIMALILFDKPASELSAIESLQVAEGLAELGGIGPFGGNGITGSARQALGLDLLNVNVDQNDSAASSLTIGKYVADGLFVSATQDARGESGSVRVEYEIDNSFTVETEIRQDGDQTVSANWKKDF